MSLDATVWAWKTRQKKTKGGATKPLKKLVLLALADRAGEDHSCFPSIARLVEDTEMDRKTVLKIIDELVDDGVIKDTGERKGRTKQVKVYTLMGVNGREIALEVDEFEGENKNLNSPKDGTVPNTEQFQVSAERVPSFRGKSPKFGTRNLSSNLLIESKNKKTWFSWEKLEDELDYLRDPNLILEIKNASWFERELNHFEKFNADKNLDADVMIYHFADKLVQAVAKYRALESKSNPVQNKKPSSEKPSEAQLSEKQIFVFAKKLSRLDTYAGQYGQIGESYDDLAERIMDELCTAEGIQKLMPYLKQVGYKQNGTGA